MKRPSIILAAAIVLGLGTLLVLHRADTLDRRPAGSDRQDSPPTKTVRTDPSHDPERFDGVSQELKDIIIALEQAALDWQPDPLRAHHFHALRHDWRRFADAQISQLTASQIEGLIHWLDEPYPSEVSDYRQSLFLFWAFYEPADARAFILVRAQQVDREAPLPRMISSPMDRLSDDMHFVQIGHATRDSTEAWETFLADHGDPSMEKLVDGNTTAAELFAYLAADSPQEAWKQVLNIAGDEFHALKFEGFIDGVETGQDWPALTKDYLAALTEAGEKPGGWPYVDVAQRWSMEDPAAALDWFAEKASLGETKLGGDDPFAEVPPAHPESTEAKVHLLSLMYGSHKDRVAETVEALAKLADQGQDDLTGAFLDSVRLNGFSPPDLPLLEVIPHLPEGPARDEQFLGFVNATKARGSMDSLDFPDVFDEPNPQVMALRHLARKLQLDATTQAAAADAFNRIEKAERANQRRLQGDNPARDPAPLP